MQDYGERGPPIHSKGFASCFRLPFRSANPAAPPTWAQCRPRPSEARGARNPVSPAGQREACPWGTTIKPARSLPRFVLRWARRDDDPGFSRTSRPQDVMGSQ